MWLIVCLLTWSLLSIVTTGHGDRLSHAEPEPRLKCLAVLTSDKSSPIGTGPSSRPSECKIWRPKLAARSDIPTIQAPCVFSQASFRDGHGLSLLTTSEVVSDLLNQGVLDERDHYDPHGSLSPWDIVPGPVVDTETVIPAYEVRSLPGKGKGVIALRRIKQNETFLLDHPSILATLDVIGHSWTKAQESLLESALSHLPEDTRKRVLGLSSANLVPGLRLSDLVKTNVCGLFLRSGAFLIGLFTEFAVSYFERVR